MAIHQVLGVDEINNVVVIPCNKVLPFSSALTPLEKVMAVYSRHQQAQLVRVTSLIYVRKCQCHVNCLRPLPCHHS